MYQGSVPAGISTVYSLVVSYVLVNLNLNLDHNRGTIPKSNQISEIKCSLTALFKVIFFIILLFKCCKTQMFVSISRVD